MEKQRIALITGSSRGIGSGVAWYLANKGYHVHATYLKDKDLIEKKFKGNSNVTIHKLDVKDETSVKIVIETVKKISGKLHLLVNSMFELNINVDFQSSDKEIN